MPRLFGLDIAGLVNNAIGSAGGVRPAVLYQTLNSLRTAGNLTGGNNAQTVPHNCQAFVDSSTERRTGTLTTEGGDFVSILGASISPPAIPKPSDQVLLDGVTYTITEIAEVDPAQALYRCRVES